jgi:hypothetical protein
MPFGGKLVGWKGTSRVEQWGCGSAAIKAGHGKMKANQGKSRQSSLEKYSKADYEFIFIS